MPLNIEQHTSQRDDRWIAIEQTNDTPGFVRKSAIIALSPRGADQTNLLLEDGSLECIKGDMQDIWEKHLKSDWLPTAEGEDLLANGSEA